MGMQPSQSEQQKQQSLLLASAPVAQEEMLRAGENKSSRKVGLLGSQVHVGKVGER